MPLDREEPTMAETKNPTPANEDAKAGTGFQQDSPGAGDAAHPDNRQGKLNERLDDALEETFPSSDPVSVKITK